MTYTADSHEGVTQMFWPHFWGALMTKKPHSSFSEGNKDKKIFEAADSVEPTAGQRVSALYRPQSHVGKPLQSILDLNEEEPPK